MATAFHIALPTGMQDRIVGAAVRTPISAPTQSPTGGGFMDSLGENGPLIIVGLAAAAALFFFKKPASSSTPAPAAVSGYRSRRRHRRSRR